jgi:hypothetical protein
MAQRPASLAAVTGPGVSAPVMTTQAPDLKSDSAASRSRAGSNQEPIQRISRVHSGQVLSPTVHGRRNRGSP